MPRGWQPWSDHWWLPRCVCVAAVGVPTGISQHGHSATHVILFERMVVVGTHTQLNAERKLASFDFLPTRCVRRTTSVATTASLALLAVSPA